MILNNSATTSTNDNRKHSAQLFATGHGAATEAEIQTGTPWRGPNQSRNRATESPKTRSSADLPVNHCRKWMEIAPKGRSI